MVRKEPEQLARTEGNHYWETRAVARDKPETSPKGQRR